MSPNPQIPNSIESHCNTNGTNGTGDTLVALVTLWWPRWQLGDPTLSVLELWGAEYQESNALLVRPGALELLRRLAERERCPLSVVGTVTGDGR
ncbi:hypothetical protein HGM15179_022303, partial [Zosterops borbonicus]